MLATCSALNQVFTSRILLEENSDLSHELTHLDRQTSKQQSGSVAVRSQCVVVGSFNLWFYTTHNN